MRNSSAKTETRRVINRKVNDSMKKKFVTIVLCVVIACTGIFSGCSGIKKEGKYSEVDKSLLYGMDEPISEGKFSRGHRL